jgi:hypothetical protein
MLSRNCRLLMDLIHVELMLARISADRVKLCLLNIGTYKSLIDSDYNEYVQYIRGLPTTDGPELFGLHSNAAITLQMGETRKIMETILLLQPRVTSSACMAVASRCTPV